MLARVISKQPVFQFVRGFLRLTKTVVILGNIGDLTKEVTRLYGRKPLWITEYGYQTRPPDRTFGVAWKTQAKYLAHPSRSRARTRASR